MRQRIRTLFEAIILTVILNLLSNGLYDQMRGWINSFIAQEEQTVSKDVEFMESKVAIFTPRH